MNYQGELTVRDLINRSLNDLNISIPAVVVGTENLSDGFVDVKPVVNYMNSLTRETVEYPVIYEVPLVFPSTVNSTICFPVSQGDFVTLLFQSTYIKNFSLGDTETQDPPYPSVSDISQAIAFVGFSPYQDSCLNPNNYKQDFDNQDLNIVHNKNTNNEAIVSINTDGDISLKSPTKVSVECKEFEVNASEKIKLTSPLISENGR